MTTMLYHLWARHHLRPGEFWRLPRGERLLLLAFSQKEIEQMAAMNPS
ncbi:hypothetical protein [Paenibacillus favisporus]